MWTPWTVDRPCKEIHQRGQRGWIMNARQSLPLIQKPSTHPLWPRIPRSPLPRSCKTKSNPRHLVSALHPGVNRHEAPIDRGRILNMGGSMMVWIRTKRRVSCVLVGRFVSRAWYPIVVTCSATKYQAAPQRQAAVGHLHALIHGQTGRHHACSASLKINVKNVCRNDQCGVMVVNGALERFRTECKDYIIHLIVRDQPVGTCWAYDDASFLLTASMTVVNRSKQVRTVIQIYNFWWNFHPPALLSCPSSICLNSDPTVCTSYSPDFWSNIWIPVGPCAWMNEELVRSVFALNISDMVDNCVHIMGWVGAPGWSIDKRYVTSLRLAVIKIVD